MRLQVAVDTLSLKSALKMLEKVADHVDIIEAGTPLIKSEGMAAVRAFKSTFPDKLIVADMKTMDAGALEANLAFEAGADIVTILGAACNGTIRGAVQAARAAKKYVAVDLISVHDKIARAAAIESMGADYVGIHTGLDEQSNGQTPFSEMLAIGSITAVPLAVAGGINADSIARVEAAGAEIAIVGSAIYGADDPGEAARKIRSKIAGVQSMPALS